MSRQVDQAAAWIYQGLWASVVALFRVPSEPPTLPAAGEVVRSLRPAAGYLRYLKFFFWLAFIPGDILPAAGWVALANVRQAKAARRQRFRDAGHMLSAKTAQVNSLTKGQHGVYA